jgi:hypothetical protein
MNLTDIQLLQSIRGYPSLSIFLPTHRTSPDNKQDPIRVRRLVTEATNRLLGEFSKREVEPLLLNLETIGNEIDYRHTLDGLAIFVNQDFARKFYLPFPVRERITVDEGFATRDLVHALNRTSRYWVLALSEQPTRLYEGTRETLEEITGGGFPMVHTGPGGEAPLPGGHGVRKSAYEDEYHRKFFRDVDRAFGAFAASEPLPLAVVGVDRHQAHFSEVTQHRRLIAATVTGSHDRTPAHELGKLVWPAVKAHLTEQRNKVLDELAAAVSGQRYVSTIGEAWRLAQDGRIETLLVEEDFHYPARVDDSGRHLEPAEDVTAPDVIDDAVDEVIEMVLQKGGRVVFVDDGTLDKHGQIAAILRY